MVLAAVPLVFQSGRPPEAVKKTVPPTPMKSSGKDPPLPELISSTMNVPAGVPLLIQSSAPFVPSLAWKYRLPLMAVRNEGPELPLGLISLKREVPASEPSLLHNSKPCVPSSVSKKSVPLRRQNAEDLSRCS